MYLFLFIIIIIIIIIKIDSCYHLTHSTEGCSRTIKFYQFIFMFKGTMVIFVNF